MSVRHQMRMKVEELFKLMIEDADFPGGEEVNVYVVFVPHGGEFEEEDIEVSEQTVDTEDRESVKKFLDRTTRESLEADVKGLRLYGYVFETGKGLKIITQDNQDFSGLILTRIERMREEV
ncbi:hypothetical protein BCF55_0402 [Hydrogenivirga caldilitoris]|uniref:Uncharacterized protein n=1 Tax=Hydrogenivirga caldilitoris TaxID=246264 RepID=A0A497XMS0_9AQUI|nr:hypothetical protein [Hydrogenivirga caldilitoris]RLJ70138.1 hypothetical protein BCF55_0402 [Hydrogenivirga caldilitoris]